MDGVHPHARARRVHGRAAHARAGRSALDARRRSAMRRTSSAGWKRSSRRLDAMDVNYSKSLYNVGFKMKRQQEARAGERGTHVRRPAWAKCTTPPTAASPLRPHRPFDYTIEQRGSARSRPRSSAVTRSWATPHRLDARLRQGNGPRAHGGTTPRRTLRRWRDLHAGGWRERGR